MYNTCPIGIIHKTSEFIAAQKFSASIKSKGHPYKHFLFRNSNLGVAAFWCSNGERSWSYGSSRSPIIFRPWVISSLLMGWCIAGSHFCSSSTSFKMKINIFSSNDGCRRANDFLRESQIIRWSFTDERTLEKVPIFFMLKIEIWYQWSNESAIMKIDCRMTSDKETAVFRAEFGDDFPDISELAAQVCENQLLFHFCKKS